MINLLEIPRGGLAAGWRAVDVVSAPQDIATQVAEALLEIGKAEEASQAVEHAAAVLGESGERLYHAEIYRLKGELMLRSYSASGRLPKAVAQQVERCLRKAIDVAREQQGRSWELRAAVSLARLWRRQRKGREAHALLAEVDSWFTEGASTPDRRAARLLLDELAADAS